LILDEATSSLDSIAETCVQNTIRLLQEESITVIVIAHRLSTINLAQRVIMLEKGLVVQDGSLEELSIIDGPFRRMWTHQTIDVQKAVRT
jgi:ABC-type multidrug transport system fused ATPase/permease subunit